MEKEIVGHKWRKWLEEAVREQAAICSLNIDDFTNIYTPKPSLVSAIEEAGMLDVLLEPVYKEPEFEFGRWYKRKSDSKAIWFITGKYTGYGFSLDGEWVDFSKATEYAWELYNFAPATDEEVKERLLAYAKEHYPVGTKVKGARFPDSDFVYTIDLLQYKDDYIICNRNMSYVFYEGKWAEIIKEVPIKINGYEAKFEDKHVSFGCHKVSIKFIKKVHELITKHNVDFNANKEQIKKIVEHYK